LDRLYLSDNLPNASVIVPFFDQFDRRMLGDDTGRQGSGMGILAMIRGLEARATLRTLIYWLT
jgi:hypothetical protein